MWIFTFWHKLYKLFINFSTCSHNAVLQDAVLPAVGMAALPGPDVTPELSPLVNKTIK